MVLAKGLHSHPEYGPAGRPVHPPDQLSPACHGDSALAAAGADIVHCLGIQVESRNVSGVRPAADLADGIKRAPALGDCAATDLFQYASYVVLPGEGGLDGIVVFALFVEDICPVDLRFYAEPFHALQEGSEEMVGIAGAAALRAGYLRKGLAYMLIEALRQEGVEPTQPVEGVGDVDQTRLYPSVQESAIDGLCGHDLAHVADVNRSGGGNAGSDGMGARAFQLLGDDISPVNRHVPQSMQGGDIKLPLSSSEGQKSHRELIKQEGSYPG